MRQQSDALHFFPMKPGVPMTTAASTVLVVKGKLLSPILVGGALAGTFDITAAFITFGLGNPRVIAGG